MKKTFCDLCGNPADAPDKITLLFDGKVLCDEKAKIQIRLTTGFVEHSTGFGGPPDICASCLREITDAVRCKSTEIWNRAVSQRQEDGSTKLEQARRS